MAKNKYNMLGLLKNMPNTIYSNLIGNSNILINSNKDRVILYGDNREFKGNLILPYTVNTLYYKNTQSTITTLKQLNKDGTDVMYNITTNNPDLSRLRIIRQA